MELKLTLCVPCFDRPMRTLRAMESVVNQDMNGWEAYFVGDNCPKFKELLDSKAFEPLIEKAKQNGNIIHAYNLPQHSGGWGYEVRNHIFGLANGNYTLFLDNDDVLLPNHFRNYYDAIANTDNDFVYLDTFIEPLKRNRVAELVFGSIGHHEIIIKTDFLKKIPPQLPHYGHDWTLIEDMIKAGAKYTKASDRIPTYVVKGLGELRQDTIN